MEIHEKEAMNVKLAEIREWSAYWLSCSDMADCGSPDSKESPGAVFLTSVRDQTCDLIDETVTEFFAVDDFDNLDDDGSLHQIADSAPDIYTYQRWTEFADLAAWQEEPGEEYGDEVYEGRDMTEMAGLHLFMIADRLARNIVQAVKEAVEVAELPDEDED